jgi:hypothetical protein
MKKKILKVTLVVAIAMACGISFLNSQKSEALSDIALANVEALAALNPTESCLTVCYSFDGWMCTRIYNGETSRCIDYRKR